MNGSMSPIIRLRKTQDTPSDPRGRSFLVLKVHGLELGQGNVPDRPEQTSVMKATETNPARVATCVRSATQSRLSSAARIHRG